MAGGSKSKTSSKEDPNITYEHGSLVLATVPGYPKWPGCVVEKPHIPDNVVQIQPKNKPFVIRYLPTADYAFAKKAELTPLNDSMIDKFLGDSSKSKLKTAKSLYTAYEKCKDYKSWLKETDEIVKEANMAAEDEDQLEEEDDEDAALAPKKKAGKKEKDSKASDGKKRKREDGEGKGANGQIRGEAKKNEKKSKDSTASAKKQKTDKPASSSKAGAGDDDDDAESLDPETVKVKKWRHDLQRAFLGKDGTLKAEDMEANDAIFKKVEGYPMKVEQLRLSKIGKVMKRIVTLPGTIPRDEDFHFRKRAEALVNKWSNVLSSNGTNESGNDSKGADSSMVGQEAPSQDKVNSPPKNDTTASTTNDLSSNGKAEEKSQETPAASSSAAEPKQDE